MSTLAVPTADSATPAAPADPIVPPWIISSAASTYYVSTSVLLTLFNKALFSTWDFHHPLTIILGQSLTTVVLFILLRLARLNTLPEALNLRAAFSPSFLRKLLPLAFWYFLMVSSGLFALNFTSLLIFNTLRRLTVVFVLVVQRLHPPSSPSQPSKTSIPTVLSIFVIAAGALVAGAADIHFDPKGYAYLFVVNLATAYYLVLIPRAKSDLAVDNFALLFLNSVASLPPLFVLIAFTREFTAVRAYPYLFDTRFTALFATSCVLGTVINHSIFVNTTVNSPLTQSVSAHIKDALLLALSYIAFDQDMTAPALAGVLISFAGSIAYGVIKYKESNVAAPGKVAEKEKSEKEELISVVGKDSPVKS